MSWKTRVLEGFSVSLNWIFLSVLLIWAFPAFLLTLTHVALTFDKTPYPIIAWLPNLILGLFGTDPTALIANNKYEVIVADMIAICAFVFAIAPVIQSGIYKIDLRRKLRKAHGLEVFKVKQEGIDDLEKMLECYDRAEHITVFCGDFDWLQSSNTVNSDKYKKSSEKQKKKLREKAKQMEDFVVNYASQQKITLISSKGIELVREALAGARSANSLFEKLENRFVFNANIGIKCSLIEKINNKYEFLFRSHSDDKDHSFNAHFFKKATEGEELINILHKLIESGDWKNKAGTHLALTEQSEQS